MHRELLAMDLQSGLVSAHVRGLLEQLAQLSAQKERESYVSLSDFARLLNQHSAGQQINVDVRLSQLRQIYDSLQLATQEAQKQQQKQRCGHNNDKKPKTKKQTIILWPHRPRHTHAATSKPCN